MQQLLSLKLALFQEEGVSRTAESFKSQVSWASSAHVHHTTAYALFQGSNILQRLLQNWHLLCDQAAETQGHALSQ